MRRDVRRADLRDLRLLGRHQIAAFVGTSADFGAMIALVELAHLAPETATVLSAITGGIVNFSLSRGWAFRGRHAGSTTGQAGRYALVSFGGALLNALLLGIVLRGLHLVALDVPYPFARAIVSVAVSLLYTYPLHTRVVFRVAGAPDARDTRDAGPEGASS